MGSILSAIVDDIEEYRYLCARFNEPVQYSRTAQGIPVEDCYGSHMDHLRELRQKLEARKLVHIPLKFADEICAYRLWQVWVSDKRKPKEWVSGFADADPYERHPRLHIWVMGVTREEAKHRLLANNVQAVPQISFDEPALAEGWRRVLAKRLLVFTQVHTRFGNTRYQGWRTPRVTLKQTD